MISFTSEIFCEFLVKDICINVMQKLALADYSDYSLAHRFQISSNIVRHLQCITFHQHIISHSSTYNVGNSPCGAWKFCIPYGD